VVYLLLLASVRCWRLLGSCVLGFHDFDFSGVPVVAGVLTTWQNFLLFGAYVFNFLSCLQTNIVGSSAHASARYCPTRRSAGLSKSEGNSGMAGTGQEKRVKKMEIHDIFSGGNFVHKV